MTKLTHSYKDIISLENLLLAWKEFRKGKREKLDVQIFEGNLMSNIIQLQDDLKTKSYRHSKYVAFNISDPKPRVIHKAIVKDRLLHHAVHRVLYPFFDRKFISDSYSCRIGKGTYAALNKFRKLFYTVSKNDTKTVWVLKCDIKKFFATVDHEILVNMLKNHIEEKDTIWLLLEIIDSFKNNAGKGIPLGNLTSQLFANIYMDKFDKFVKHRLKVKYYIRYADDFVFMSHDKNSLLDLLPKMEEFIWKNLCLKLNNNKTLFKTFSSGVDFLGWVHFSDHRVLRTVSKRRMFRNISLSRGNKETIQSYLGLLSHGNTFKLQQEIERTTPQSLI